MKTIHKVQIRLDDDWQGVKMLPGAVVKVGEQGGIPTLWSLVDTSDSLVIRHFAITGTGHPIPEGGWYLGTYQDGPFVWHVWEQH